MELDELKTIWQQFDAKLEKSLQVNLQCLDMLQKQHLKSTLAPFFWYRGIEIFFHSAAIILLIAFLALNYQHWTYAFSAIGLLVFYTPAFINCLNQIRTLSGIDYTKDILNIQSALEKLRTHIADFGRLSILCIPCYLCYPLVVSKAIEDLRITGLNFMDIRAAYTGDWWSIQIIVMTFLAPICTWMYISLNNKNIHRRWVRKTLEKISGSRVTKSIEFLNELELLKKAVI